MPLLRGHAVALAPMRLSKAEVMERLSTADSSYEHDAFKWLKLTRRNVERYIAAPRIPDPSVVGTAVAIGEERWLEQARLALTEAWRFRSALLE